MNWTEKAIDKWIENYYLLRDYELNPFEFESTYRGEKFIHGRLPSDSPTDELFDMNWEFDKAIKSLGELGSQVFKLRYLEGRDLDEIQLDYPDKEIRKSWRNCRRRLIKYLLREGNNGVFGQVVE